MPGNFAGGFAEGWSQSSNAASEKKRLRDVMNFEREKFEYEKTQDTQNYQLNVDQLDFQKAQESSLEEHRDFADSIAQQQQAMQAREFDLKVMESLFIATDPTKPKGVRQFVLKQTAQTLGIDPKSESYKDMEKLVTGLDPDALTAVSEGLMAAIPDMQPGQAQALGKAVLSGQVQLPQLLDFFKGSPTQLKEIGDPTSSTGTRFVEEQDAIGREGPPARPTVSIENKAESAETVGLVGVDVKQIEAVMEDAAAGRSQLPAIRTFRAALDSGRFKPGTAAGIRATLGRVAEGLGMDPGSMGLGENDPAVAEVMEASGNQIILELADQLSRLTNMSLDVLVKSGGNITRTPAGNRLILDLAEMKAQRAIEVERLYNQFRNDRTTGGTLRPEGKPSFFEERDRLIADLDEAQGPAMETRISKAGESGQIVDWSKVPGVLRSTKDAVQGALEEPSAANNWKGDTAQDEAGNTITWDGSKWLNEDGTEYGATSE